MEVDKRTMDRTVEGIKIFERLLLEGTGGSEPTGLISPKPKKKKPRMQLGPDTEAVPNRHERRLHQKRLRLAIKKAFRETQHGRKVAAARNVRNGKFARVNKEMTA